MVGLQLVSAGLTDRGQKRSVNEDTILDHTGVTEAGDSFGIFIVCDGLGGHRAGDVASRLAVRTITQELEEILPPLPANQISSADINQKIWTAVQIANRKVWSQAENGDTETQGMGTTVTMAAVINGMAHTAHVGDSRLYLLRNGKLEQLTQDHTMAAALAEAGHISKDEVDNHPRQNVLTKALGRQETIDAEMMELPLAPGDKLLLCSDGLWKAFKGKDALEKRLNSRQRAADLCEALVEEANELDGSDNISLVVVSAHERAAAVREREVPRVRSSRAQEAVPA